MSNRDHVFLVIVVAAVLFAFGMMIGSYTGHVEGRRDGKFDVCYKLQGKVPDSVESEVCR